MAHFSPSPEEEEEMEVAGGWWFTAIVQAMGVIIGSSEI